MTQLPPPRIIELELSNYCQLRCPMCPHRIMTRKKGNLSPALVQLIAPQLRPFGVERMILHQIGEPLLNPDWLEITRIVTDQVPASFSTNGLLLTPENIEKILISGLQGITVCLDGDESCYESYRVGADFKIISDNIHALAEAIQRSHLKKPSLTLQILNMADTDVILGLKKRFQPVVRGIGSIFVKEFTTWDGSSEIPNLGNTTAPEIPLRERCNKPKRNMVIQWNGDVVACCRDYNGSEVFGNVSETPLAEIWNGPKIQQFRQNLKLKNFSELCCKCFQ